MQAVGLVNQLDASLLKDAAGLHFQLQVAIFKQHVQEDRTSEAISCLQTVITPLAVQCEDAKLQRQSQVILNLLLQFVPGSSLRQWRCSAACRAFL